MGLKLGMDGLRSGCLDDWVFEPHGIILVVESYDYEVHP